MRPRMTKSASTAEQRTKSPAGGEIFAFRARERKKEQAMDIPKDKSYPPDSVQCDECGGHGCEKCGERGWFTPSTHPLGRKCYRDGCTVAIPPAQVAVYCSYECADSDA